MSRKSLKLLLGSTLSVSLLVLSACGMQVSASSESNPLPRKLGDSGIDPQLSEYYQQKLTWNNCLPETKTDLQEQENPAGEAEESTPGETSRDTSQIEGAAECAKVEVPLDYKNPQGKKIKIALTRVKASGEKLGSLFVNPGGPGASGQDFLPSAQQLVSEKVQQHYDLIGFDPRGVGESAPVTCFTDQELDRERSEYVPMTTRQEAEANLEQIKQSLQKCRGEVLPYASTEFSSRDLDIMRHVVGDDKLSYLGYSYGSLLGSEYSQNFPHRVGRMVLDGILARSYSYNEVVEAQVKGFEASIREWVRWCVEEAKSCPYQKQEEGVQDLIKILNTPAEYPTSQAKRPLTLPLLQEAVVGCMYNSAYNNSLLEALISLKKYNRGDSLLTLADLFSKRGGDGKYEDNSYSAFLVINSSDYPVTDTPEDWDRHAKTLQEKYPLLGKAMGYGEYQLTNWAWPSSYKREPLQVSPGAPIMLIGNRHDPATPYEMAQRVHQELAKSVLITVDSYAHTAYGDSNACVKENVDNYLLNGTNRGDVDCG